MSETIEQLLDAAEGAIRLRGYHAVSFRELADDIGIKSASVHYHFPQKDDLGVALVERYSERLFAELERRSAKAKTPEDKLRAFYGVYRDALVGTDSICLCVMLGAESRGLPAGVSGAVKLFFEANIAWLGAALDASLTAKSRKAKASTILATLQGGMMLATALQDHKLFDAIVSELRSAHV
ncbi:MAG: TetR/AcrR family transcriptional regulator [Hyphomicrobiaceae bacterium]